MPLFRDLFLKPKGTVDITSSTVHFEEKTGKFVDEASWAPKEGGAVLCNAFSYLMTKEDGVAALDLNKNKTVEWEKEFFPALRQQTMKNFRAFKPNELSYYKGSEVLFKDYYNYLPDWVKRLNEQKDQTPRLLKLDLLNFFARFDGPLRRTPPTHYALPSHESATGTTVNTEKMREGGCLVGSQRL